jgi:N-acetyl-gamma-glutamyl-phosphate reductase
MLKAAIVGASGYTGAELIRLLLAHPKVEITALYARRAAGSSIGEVFPQLAPQLSMTIEAFDPDHVAANAEVAFCALPHGQSARAVAALYERGLKVVDLSADYRLRSAASYAEWYGSEKEPEHPHPELIGEAAYGLPELHRGSIRVAKITASPGCYPTSAILALSPLVRAGLISTEGIVVDAKSGVTGAGRSPGQATHFPEAGEGVRAYKVGGLHRHTAEIEQELGAIAGNELKVTFTPHLLPMSRGILCCAYARPSRDDVDTAALRKAMNDAYGDEPFVRVMPEGKLPDTAHVRGSNRAQVTALRDRRSGQVIAISAIDNLVKGASGQAIQALNLMQGWDETLGLMGGAIFP